MHDFDELNEFLKKVGLPPIEEMEPDPAKQAALAEKLAGAFAALAEADKAGDQGGYKIRIGNIHYPLSRSAWPLLELGAKLTLAGVKHSAEAAGEAVVSFVLKVKDLITKLDEVERFIYESVARVSEIKHESGKILIEPGASEKELEAHFKVIDVETPRNLAERLQKMAEKGVLKSDTYGDRGPVYQVVF